MLTLNVYNVLCCESMMTSIVKGCTNRASTSKDCGLSILTRSRLPVNDESHMDLASLGTLSPAHARALYIF